MSQKNISNGLKVFSAFVAFVGAVFFFWYVPTLIYEVAYFEDLDYLRWPGTIGMWVIAFFCYVALAEFWKICTNIGNDNSFSMANAKSMARIGLCGLAVFILILGGSIFVAIINMMSAAIFFIIFFAEAVAIGMIVICFALSKLIENAAKIKEENDLTI